jgi:hypothetical protein
MNKKLSPHNSDRLLGASSRKNAKSLESRRQHKTSMMKVKQSPSINKSVVEIEYNENIKKI